jgi:hypothetical protein
MGEDEVVNNMGQVSSVFLPLHGKVGWTPASRVQLTVGEGWMSLEGDLVETNVFGVNLLIETRLTLRAGSAAIEIEDRLRNRGVASAEYEMLYHTNFGPPFLEEGGRYFSNSRRGIPRDGAAVAGADRIALFPGPEAGFVEQVFLFAAEPDGEGFAHQVVTNADGTLGVHVAFGAESLPYTILWKRCAAQEEGYVFGLNPCSDLPNPRRVERAAGRLAVLPARAEVLFRHRIEPLRGSSSVDATVESLGEGADSFSLGAPGDFDFLAG